MWHAAGMIDRSTSIHMASVTLQAKQRTHPTKLNVDNTSKLRTMFAQINPHHLVCLYKRTFERNASNGLRKCDGKSETTKNIDKDATCRQARYIARPVVNAADSIYTTLSLNTALDAKQCVSVSISQHNEITRAPSLIYYNNCRNGGF